MLYDASLVGRSPRYVSRGGLSGSKLTNRNPPQVASLTETRPYRVGSKSTVCCISAEDRNEPSRPYTQLWYGQRNALHCPSPSTILLPRCRHELAKARMTSSSPRTTMS